MSTNNSNIREIRCHSCDSSILFVAGGATGGGAAAAGGGTRSTFKLASDGKGKGRHHPLNFLALAFGAGNLFGCVQY